jgi:hypothetical protein
LRLGDMGLGGVEKMLLGNLAVFEMFERLFKKVRMNFLQSDTLVVKIEPS